ncbi:MAG: sodium:solute symporter, partial [Planctomycetes bacterium]|nr:sodium:solute symporter [Planctomycetota bacterium]
YETGMEFVQTYFGLAFAMVLLSIFFVPLYRAQPILTAYEFLERRFGPATRTLAALIFLVSRCLAFGVVLYAPSVVMSAMLGIPLTWTVLGIGALTTLYTTVGGVRAVIATDVKQMLVIIGGLLLILVLLLVEVVPALGFTGALRVLGATGKLNAVEFVPESLEFVPQLRGSAVKSFWNEKYNFWSGTLGGLFLMLSYFGCDQ